MDVDEEQSLYKRGAIKCISLKNFLTFGTAPDGSPYVITFQPRINIVCGPNGLGKSSIVAAIVLCCGGRPNFLKRAKVLTDFIQREKTEATIELTLHDPSAKDEQVRFRRIIGKKSGYFINGSRELQKDYIRRLREFGIRPENLTQFLPQDRVSNIPGLSPAELLVTTEEALSNEVYDMHRELIERRILWLPDQENLRQMKARSETHVRKRGELDNSIRQLRREDKDKELLMSTRLKLMILEWKKTEKELGDAQSKLNLLNERKTSVGNEKMTPYKDQINVVRSRLVKSAKPSVALMVETKLTTLNNSLGLDDSSKDEVREHKTHLLALLARIKDLDDRAMSEETLSQDISRMETEKDQMNNSEVNAELASSQETQSDLMAEIESLENEKDSLSDKLDQHSNELQSLRESLESLNSTANSQRRLKNLVQADKISPDVLYMFEELQRNPAKYTGRVTGPLFLYIYPKDQMAVKYLESVFEDCLDHFVCDTRETLLQMNKEFCLSQEKCVSFCCSQPDLLQRPAPGFIAKDKENFSIIGFKLILRDLFSANDEVKRYLDQVYSTSTILISPDGDHLQAASLTRYWARVKAGLKERLIFCTKDCLYTEVHKSGFVKNTSLVDPVFLSYLDSAINSPESRSRLQKDIERMEKTVEKDSTDMETLTENLEGKRRQLKTVDADLESLSQAMPDLDLLSRDLENTKKQLAAAKAAERKPQPDNALLNTLREKIRRVNLRRRSILTADVVTYMEALSASVHETCQTAISATGDLLSMARSFRRLLSVHEDAKETTVEIERLTALIPKLEGQIVEGKSHVLKLIQELYVDRKKGIADVQAIFKSLNNYKTPSSLVKHLGVLDRTLRHTSSEKIDDIAKLQRQNLEAAREYESELQARNQLEFDLKVKQISQLELKKHWFEKLSSDIAVISLEMQTMFQRMDYDGQLRLTEPADELDYESYGLLSEVKFRESDQLTRLTDVHQSGGERVLAIAVFLLALQKCSKSPFRIVDEINQGMDYVNERNIFQLMLDASQWSDTQYISCSPKIPPFYEENSSENLNFCFLMKTSDAENPGNYSIPDFCRALKMYELDAAQSDSDNLLSEDDMSE